MERTSVVAVLVAAAFGASSLPGLAQQGNPAGASPSSMAPASAPVPSPQDRLFVLLAGQGGLAEVELAKLAQSKAQSQAVKQFASRMIEEHTKANSQLTTAARQSALEPPSVPAAEHEAMRSQLASVDGASFDDAYLRSQLVEHQKAAQLLQWEMGNGQQAPLQRFAASTLPAVLDHLGHVQQLLAELTGAPTRTSDGPITSFQRRP